MVCTQTTSGAGGSQGRGLAGGSTLQPLLQPAPVPPHVVVNQGYGVYGTLQKAITIPHAYAWHDARQTRQHTLVQAGSPDVRHGDRHERFVPCSQARLKRFSKRSMASRTSSARLV